MTNTHILDKDKSNNGLLISDLIEAVHDQLLESQSKRLSKGLPPLFVPESLELEIKFTVRRISTGKGKLDFKLFAVEGGRQQSSERVHTIKLLLKTITQDMIKETMSSVLPKEK